VGVQGMGGIGKSVLASALAHDKEVSRAFPDGIYWLTAVALTPNGRRAVSGSADNTLRVWDLETGETLKTLQGHTSSVGSVALSPDGRQAVSASRDSTLRVWDLKAGKELVTFTIDGIVAACCVAQYNRIIVAGDGFGRLHFLQLVEADKTKPSIGDNKIPLYFTNGNPLTNPRIPICHTPR